MVPCPTRRPLLTILAALLVAPRIAAAAPPVPCTGSHGNVLVCGNEPIYGLTVTAERDGTYNRVSWREHFGDARRWRDIALHGTGLVHFVFDPGEGNASKWLTLAQWTFPRTQRLTISRYPGELRFDVTDCTGTVWTLLGTPAGSYDASFVVESIGGRQQGHVKPAATHEGVMGVDLATTPLYLAHRVVSFSPRADFRAPAYLRTRSTFRDRRGGSCAVPNGEIFGTRPDRKGRDFNFQFDTDAELLEFLSKRCPRLDLEPLRTARPVPPPPRERFNKCLPGTAMIGTPSGAVRVDELVVGALVWTVDERGARVAAPVVRVSAVDVGDQHELLRISLADGRTVQGSRYHPTAAGSFLGELAPGDLVDGSTVVRMEPVRHQGSRTFDLLPSGSTGHYYADGVLLGSTLRATAPSAAAP